MRHTIIVVLMGLAGLARADATSESTAALVRGDFRGAADAAEKGLASDPNNGWLHYNKGAALADLGQLDMAIAELRLAQKSFSDLHWKGLALYRIAIAEEQAQRCEDAQRDFAEYAQAVRASEPEGAEVARHEGQLCGQAPSPDRQPVSGHEPK